MRRHQLPPPRATGVTLPADAFVDARPRPRTPPRRSRILDARPARQRLRRLFDPARGGVRRAERAASHWLSSHVFPYLPAASLLYDAQLGRGLTLGECDVALSGLDPRLDGVTVLLVTDVHAGPFVSPRALAAAFGRLMAVEPDVVLIGGDLTTARVEEFERARAAFRRLAAPLGVWAVLGNHDHYTGEPARLRDVVESAGIGVLHNRHVAIERDGAALWLAGIDDALVGQPDLGAALDGCGRPVVLLSHNPDVFFEAATAGADLVLSGHTHAGQVRVPGLPVLVRQSRYRLDEGRFSRGSSHLIVSRGLGVVGVPFRLGCPPEAVLVRLRVADG